MATSRPLMAPSGSDGRPLVSRDRWLAWLLFFVLPAIVYWAVVTRLGFDLFAPRYGWQAYNYLALSLAEGRQSVPADAIAAEGTYVGGSVYMYYGLLPAILRLPLIPFVDLRTVPVSNLMVLAMLITGQWALQAATLRIFIANGRNGVVADRVLLVIVSASIWLCSGTYLIAKDGNFYHEPYAAALMLVSIFMAMLVGDLLVDERRPAGGRLLAYALVAGLAVFTRQTCAVGLYIAVLALLLPTWVELRARPGPTLAKTLRRAAVPLAVLFLAGAAYLASNYLRTGRIGTGWAVRDYGYYIIGNNRPRLETLVHQQFSLVRIGPNLLYTLVGSAEWRERMIAALGGGLVETHGRSVKWLIFAPLPLLFAATGIVCLWRRAKSCDPLAPIVLVTLGFAATAVVLLAYATMAYRYTAEIWPLLAWLSFIAYRDIDPRQLFGRFTTHALATMAALVAASVAYTSAGFVRFDDSPTDRGSLRIGVALAPELAVRATAPGARAPEMLANRAAAGPDPDLPPDYRPPGAGSPAVASPEL